MSASCQSCGNRLSSDGSCPACLMSLGVSGYRSNSQPGGRFQMPEVHELNATFPQFEFRSLIGLGGMGAVYRAYQTALDRDVAIKLIHREYSSEVTFIERFAREAKTLAKLSHPHIVNVYDFGQTPNGIAYFVMEYVDGINLRQVIQSRGVTIAESLDLIKSICSALEYAHGKGIVHRDIKPENILLGEDGVPKLADFGIAKIINDGQQATSLTMTRQVLGSPNYLAPEHIEAPDLIDHRIDIYSLGIVLYELLTGQLPLGRFEPPSSINPNVSAALDAIVMKALHRKPGSRHQSAAELYTEIASLESSPMPASQPVQSNARRQKSSVPFEWESANGMKWAVGVIRAVPNALRIEFKYRDPFFGKIKSKLRVVEIPVDRLERITVSHGIFSSKMTITADAATTLGDLPESETGSVSFKIKTSDRDLADQVLETLGVINVAALHREQRRDATDPQNIVLGILLILLGIANAGSLAICHVVNQHVNSSADKGLEMTSIAIAVSVLLGPLAALQIVLGIVHLVSRIPSLGKAACVLSMLPITPVFPFSIAVGIWGYKFLDDLLPTENASSPTNRPKANWGATTMMYLRESRTARIASIANGVGLAAGIAGMVVYFGGFYPTTMSFRIVDSGWDRSKLQVSVEARLAGVYDTRIYIPDPSTSLSNQLTIRNWKFRKAETLSKLAIANQVSLVALAQGDNPLASEREKSEEAEWFPVASSLSTKTFVGRKESLGTQLLAKSELVALAGAMVGKVTRDSDGKLTSPSQMRRKIVVSLTALGRETLDDMPVQEADFAGVGLVVDGVIQAIAQPTEINNETIIFRYADEDALDPTAIIAAIHGPKLAAELEPL